jgi:cell division protein FtsL
VPNRDGEVKSDILVLRPGLAIRILFVYMAILVVSELRDIGKEVSAEEMRKENMESESIRLGSIRN